jgi:catechol 2,3-dioxygenase-like lactoylglutathione lyase family enzyme
MRIDHIVLWVEDPLRSLAFYGEVLGFAGVRVEEFRAGSAPFPSVRVTTDTLIDLMARAGAEAAGALTGVPGSAGHPLNHVCFSMSAAELAALRARLVAAQVPIGGELARSFGALGYGRAFYFRDPDGNVLEARTYEAG